MTGNRKEGQAARFNRHFALMQSRLSTRCIAYICEAPCCGSFEALLLQLTWNHGRVMTWGGDVDLLILNLRARWSECSASSPARCNPEKRGLSTYWTGSWVGPRAGLDVFEDRKTYCWSRKSNHDTSDAQPVAWSHYTASRLHRYTRTHTKSSSDQPKELQPAMNTVWAGQ